VWSRSMEVRHGEVDLMLRKPVKTSQEIHYTLASAEAGLLFMDQLETLAKRLHATAGQLTRWILPYGHHNQSVAEQGSRAREVMATIPLELRGRVGEREVAYLVKGANSVRRLIRVKIADDNDLNQAKESLLITARFFRRLVDEAAQVGRSPAALLAERRECDQPRDPPRGQLRGQIRQPTGATRADAGAERRNQGIPHGRFRRGAR